MSAIENLRQEHKEVLDRIHFIEVHQIDSLKKTLDRYPDFVKEFSKFVKTSLAHHFKVEEEALFPVLKGKVDPQIISNLLFDHERVMKEFHKYLEFVKDFDLSIQYLKNLINYLDIHARKEEELFSSLSLSPEEYKMIDEKAELVEL